VQIPRVERHAKHRRDVVLRARHHLFDERPILRIEGGGEDRVGVEVHEVSLLLEAIAHHPDASTDVRHESARNPGERADRAAGRGEVQLEVRGERNALERGGLLDRLVVVVDEVAELRLVARARVAGVKGEIQLRREAEADVGANGETAEVSWSFIRELPPKNSKK